MKSLGGTRVPRVRGHAGRETLPEAREVLQLPLLIPVCACLMLRARTRDGAHAMTPRGDASRDLGVRATSSATCCDK